MSSLIAFLLAAVFVCLGYAAGTFFTRRGTSRASQAAAEHAAGESVTMTSDEASTFLQRIQQVTTDVDADVGRHATRVAEISGGLNADGADGSDQVLRAAAQLQEANRLLQQDLTEARAEIQSQRGQLESYMAQALSDALTGLANRRGFDQELIRRLAHRRRGGPTLCLVLVDIDHFKRFNDEHGHQAGDAVLSQVAAVLIDCTRQMDMVARYGGEEFGLVLPGTILKEGEVVAERVRGAIEQQAFQYQGRPMSVTVSVGLAEAADRDDSAALVGRADAALYAAKDSGRNACYAHDGTRCLPLEKRVLTLVRKPTSSQRVAPFVDGRFPEPGMFKEILCEDASPTGFTYVVSERPDYDRLLVALGESATRAYSTATVQQCRSIGTETAPFYRIACRFTAPVSEFAEAVAGSSPRL